MARIRFDRFVLDPTERRLTRDGAPVELAGRYLDALLLLSANPGALVSKDRFMAEVWRGMPVTDEALTQCIRSLRRELGDDAARPRFIETVPKHGYRFVAPVEPDGEAASPTPTGSASWRDTLALAAGGTVGAGLAGLVGGILYGFLAAAPAAGAGAGQVSMLLVLTCLCTLTALVGGAGVASGIAAADRFGTPGWRVAGGALGGLLVGAVVKLVGLDAFALLLGRSPGDITGACEGLLLGAGVGTGAWLGGSASLRRTLLAGGGMGGLAGLAVALVGGRLMAGSLDLLARGFPGSRLRLDRAGVAFGEAGFGPVAQALAATLEGALFGAFLAAAMLLARRGLTPDARSARG